jgi:ABC-type amino acid transport substrate-binding protein
VLQELEGMGKDVEMTSHLRRRTEAMKNRIVQFPIQWGFVCLILVYCFLLAPFVDGQEQDRPSKPSSASAKDDESVPLKKHLKTIIVDNYYPYTFVNEKGQPDGFSVDLARSVARIMDFTLPCSRARG